MSEIEDFSWACKTGDLANVQKFVNKGISVNVTDATVNKRTPMHWASDFDQVQVLEFLLSKGANIEAKDAYGITPLLAAVYEGHDNAVRFLVSKGANKSVKGPDGMTPLEAAEKESIKAILRG